MRECAAMPAARLQAHERRHGFVDQKVTALRRCAPGCMTACMKPAARGSSI